MGSQRRFERVACRLRVDLLIGPRIIPAETLNISLGGMLVTADFEPEYGRIFSARVHLPEPDHTCEVDLQVMWSGANGFGVAFDALRPLDVWALLRYLEGPSTGQE